MHTAWVTLVVFIQVIVMPLRPYQHEAKCKILEWCKSDPAIAHTIVSVMGSGKTYFSCAAINDLVKQGKRVWVCVDREELIDQWRNELKVAALDLASYGRDVGVIMGDATPMMNRKVQLVMVQTLTRRLAKIKDCHAPDVVIYDEAHGTAFQDVARRLKLRWQNCVQINLTATPVRHGKDPVQYSDVFPKCTWFTVKTAQEMIHDGLWKIPVWKSASDSLAAVTAQRFSGMKESGGEYDDTSQSKVMIDLLPNHLREWQELGGDKHHCVWFCVDVEHVKRTVAALKAMGRKVVGITGSSGKKERKDAIAAFRLGEIDDLVNCQCLTTGFDAPIASCAVWLRRTMSVGLFNQMAGRVLRKFDGITHALLLDLAGNLALHPFPEEMDWDDFDPCKRMFRDPSMVICKKCNHRHYAIPTPLHPSDRKTLWSVALGYFNDGLQLDHKTVLGCHSCKSPVYADFGMLLQYGDWLRMCAAAKASGDKPPTYTNASAGLSIGAMTETKNEPLTIAMLYNTGVWRVSSNGESGESKIKDRSQEYLELHERAKENAARKSTIDLRFQRLNKKQQDFLVANSVAKIKAIPDHTARYRTAIARAYITDKSPVSAYKFWGEDNGEIPKSEIQQALTSIWAGNIDTYQMLEEWLQQSIEQSQDHRKRGICQTFLTVLQKDCLDSF